MRPTIINALSIDLEDWYQGLTSTSQDIEKWPTFEDRVVGSTNFLLSILGKSDTKATFFTLGYVAEKHPELIRQVANEGHEIALHGYHHYKVSSQSRDEFRAEIIRGKQAVENASGTEIIGYRAPMFSIGKDSLWALNILRELGFIYDSSIFPTKNMLYGFPEAPRFPYHPINDDNFVEFPLSTVQFFGINWPLAGGFYFRTIPYPIFKLGLERINNENSPAVIYLHPWELDPDHPRPNPTLRERITHYTNLRRTAGKLESLLKDFQFAPLNIVIQNIGVIG